MVLSTEWSQVEVIDLFNDGNGLGFILVGGRSTGVVIKTLTPGGVSERDGRLQCGDHLLQIGEVNLRGFSSEQVATVLRQTGAHVRLIVARPVEPTSTDFQTLASHAPIIPTKLLSDPEELSRHLFHNPSFATSATCAGGSGGGRGSGGSGVRGAACFLTTPDTELADLPLPPIPVELTATSSTARMCPRDLDIVPFSIVSPASTLPKTVGTPIAAAGLCTNMDHIETVIAGDAASTPMMRRSTLSNEFDCCSITSSNYMDSPETETYVVELRKNVYGLGITVAGYVCEEEDLSGIFVKSIIEGSAAEMSGKIQINDRIVAVDGKTLAGVTNHQAVEILRNTDIEVHLTLERFLRGRKYEHLQNALTELKGDTQSQTSLPASPSIATLSWLPPKSDADSIVTDGGAVIIEFNDFPSRDTVDSNMSNMLDRSDQSGTGSYAKGQKTPSTPDAKPVANGKVAHIYDNICSFDIDDNNGKDWCNKNSSEQPKVHKKLAQANGKTPTMENVMTKLSPTTAPTTTVVSMAAAKSAYSAPRVDPTKVTWKSECPDSEIIVAEINKLSGLGISLEGTVDVEGGIEKRPHHYIRSILEDGPVGKQGLLKPGDELLQVNEHKLQGLKHIEVVKILKELPSRVKLVCARGPTAPSVINTSQNPEAFETRSLLPGGHQSLQNLLTNKALSESSLYTSSTATLTDQQRSKSLENVSGVALWCTEVTTIEIEKTEQGFGFSVLDYQDPIDADAKVIVIRGLIRGGSAETTNEIFPGDRLVSVGDHNLCGVTLDEAVIILKGMPIGITTLGICRPLSTSESNIGSPDEERDSPST